MTDITCDDYHWAATLLVLTESGRQAATDDIRQRCARIALLVRHRTSQTVTLEVDDAKWVREKIGPVERVLRRVTKNQSEAAKRLRKQMASGEITED